MASSHAAAVSHETPPSESARAHWFGPDGKAVKRSQFREGQLEGVTVEYYPDGKPHIKSEYKADKLDGEVVEYTADGKIKTWTLYQFGQPVKKT